MVVAASPAAADVTVIAIDVAVAAEAVASIHRHVPLHQKANHLQ